MPTDDRLQPLEMPPFPDHCAVRLEWLEADAEMQQLLNQDKEHAAALERAEGQIVALGQVGAAQDEALRKLDGRMRAMERAAARRRRAIPQGSPVGATAR